MLQTKDFGVKPLTVGIIAVCALGAWLWFESLSKSLVEMPEISFSTITGETIDLKRWRGQPVLIAFWSTDCAICMKDIPHLVELYRHYSNKGLNMVAVAMYYDMPSRVIDLAQSRNLPYPIALDPMARIAQAFGYVRQTPMTFLVDPQGAFVLSELGAIDISRFRVRLDSMF